MDGGRETYLVGSSLRGFDPEFREKEVSSSTDPPLDCRDKYPCLDVMAVGGAFLKVCIGSSNSIYRLKKIIPNYFKQVVMIVVVKAKQN